MDDGIGLGTSNQKKAAPPICTQIMGRPILMRYLDPYYPWCLDPCTVLRSRGDTSIIMCLDPYPGKMHGQPKVCLLSL
eukprot:1158548-Pelagomonas_calceolata.AAC.3